MNPEVRSLVKDAYQKFDTIDAVVKHCWKKLRRNKPLFNEVFEELALMGLRETIYDVRHENLTALKFRPNPTTRGPEAIASLADVAKRSFLNSWTTPDNRKLGDVLGSDLPAFAETEFSNAHGHTLSARFYRAISTKVKPTKRVRDSFTDGQLRGIWETVVATTGAKGQAG